MGLDEYAQVRPSLALRPFVGFYSGYRQAGIAPARHRGLPSPYLTLIFTMDDPLEVAVHPDPRQRPGRYDALIGGLHLTPAVITHPGRQSGVQVALRPLGCRALFGLPAAELVGADLHASDVLGDPWVAEVRERLLSAPDWPSRFAAVDNALRRRLHDNPPQIKPEIVYACSRLLDDPVATAATIIERHPLAGGGGAVGPSGGAVADVAAEVGWSARYLTDRFRAEVGLRPKEAARVARFDRARRALKPGTRLADVAAVHGFADQSHLVREFHAFAGCSPTAWLADELDLIESLRHL
ncbi:AraC family transcriptional regulator [Paractinoplanes globisporus]|uniref:Helix-turn-helix domain-containing protein n=1 Tax=Paractinoplanes globisporus TaxID=113565 RepID=A0ABW6WMZ4_9ACTN|nr:helix-turn-helix domain-containing protein [Actinoplanes globisporus]